MNFDSSVLQVAIEDIIPNRFQPRLAFDNSSLTELANSIKEHGIIQPLVLRRIGDKYEIVAGERRYKAATLAGLSSVPAVIAQIDEKKSAEVAVAENVQRNGLTAIEEARSYKALLDEGYMSQEQLARKMGLSQSAISNKLRLLNLATEVQDAVLENKISERHARALLVVKEPESQIKWLNRIIEERLTVRALDAELKKEYGTSSSNGTIDIEKIKQNATDITLPVEEVTSKSEEVNPFTMGPINLGEKTTSKFFNSLESDAVNMQMTEAINPFLQRPEPKKETEDIAVSSEAYNDLIAPVESAQEKEEEPKLSPLQELMKPKVDENISIEKSSVDSSSSVINTPLEEEKQDSSPLQELMKPKAEIENTESKEAVMPEVTEDKKIFFDDLAAPSSSSSLDTLEVAPTHEQVVSDLDTSQSASPFDIAMPTLETSETVSESSSTVASGNPQEKINKLVEELRNENYKVELSSTDLSDQLIYTIIVKK